MIAVNFVQVDNNFMQLSCTIDDPKAISLFMTKHRETIDSRRRGLWGALGKAFAEGYREDKPKEALPLPQLHRRNFVQSVAAMMGQAGLPVDVAKLALPEGLAPEAIIKTLVEDIEVLQYFRLEAAKLWFSRHGEFYDPANAKEFAQSVQNVAGRLLRLSAYREYYDQAESAYLAGNEAFKAEVAMHPNIAVETIRGWYTKLNPSKGVAIPYGQAIQPDQLRAVISGLKGTLAHVAAQVRSTALCSQMDKLAEAFNPDDPNHYVSWEDLMKGEAPEPFQSRLGFLRAKKVMEENIGGDGLCLVGKPHWIIETTDHPRSKEAMDEVETKLRAVSEVRCMRVSRLLSLSIDTDIKKPDEKGISRADAQAAGMFLDSLVQDIERAAASTKGQARRTAR